jgi:hypothetical protein
MKNCTLIKNDVLNTNMLKRFKLAKKKKKQEKKSFAKR